ncbi:MAG: T9SS type A sorting domain-containing protein [Bacteroidales bacterium]
MKLFFTIVFFIFGLNVLAQFTSDSLKNNLSTITSETPNAYYDKISSKLVIGPIYDNEKYKFELYDITGTSIQSMVIQPNGKMIEYTMWLKSGIYIVIIRNSHFNFTRKFRVY